MKRDKQHELAQKIIGILDEDNVIDTDKRKVLSSAYRMLSNKIGVVKRGKRN